MKLSFAQRLRPSYIRFSCLLLAVGCATPVPMASANASYSRQYLHYNGHKASAPPTLPSAIQRAVDAANSLQGKPYVWGGGHRFLYDKGYDCSGAVSFVLHKAGLLSGPLTSSQFQDYGEPGPGRFITVYTKDGHHVFMAICGLRFDTSDMGGGRGDGPRWRPKGRTFPGYQMRHPRGF